MSVKQTPLVLALIKSPYSKCNFQQCFLSVFPLYFQHRTTYFAEQGKMRDVLQDSLATKCVFIVVGASFLAVVQGTLHCLGYGANQGVLSEPLVSIHRLHLVLFYNPSCIFNLISYFSYLHTFRL